MTVLPNCWHCGESVPVTESLHADVAGAARIFCCHGCLSAAQWIQQLGLADYYRLRTAPARKPAALNDELRANHAWTRGSAGSHVVRDAGNGQFEIMLLIDGIRCSACVWLIERALGASPGVLSVLVNAASRRARILWDGSLISLPQILDLLSRSGYRGVPLDAQALDDVRRKESRDALKRLLVAAFGAMQAMMFAAVLYVGKLDAAEASTRELFRWLGFLAATPVVLYSARPFFTGAMRSLQARQLGMDVPVALAIAMIYVASLYQAIHDTGHVYFDSVAMFVLFLLAGRYMEMRARHHAGDVTDALARLTPPFADRLRLDGTIERIAVHELRIGDTVLVPEGGIVPVDGALLSAACRVDEALLTGESSPQLRSRGATLLSGSTLIDGPVQLEVQRIGSDTTIASIAMLVGRAQAQRPRLAQLGERAAARFVMRVLSLTVLTVAVWSYIDPSRAFAAALAVLVVSCPCAFALAVPAAITRALSVLAQRGILIVKPDAIEAIATATHVVFDKTGTLTDSCLSLSDVITTRETRQSALQLAVSLARESRHPTARAIVAACGDIAMDPDQHATDVVAIPGFGLRAMVAGREVRLGRVDFALGSAGVLPSDDAVVLADDRGTIATFHFSERLRPDAPAAIDGLRAQGLQIAIASGDAYARVAHIAAELHIKAWRARLLPADKLAWIKTLQDHGGRVIVVGDGVNDAAVIAGADVGIAQAGSADIAQACSDVVLVGGKLGELPFMRCIAQQTLAILRQNHRWTMIYNFTAVPLAAAGLVHPWIAALGMSLSSVGVVLNALRIGRSAAIKHGTETGPLAVDELPTVVVR